MHRKSQDQETLLPSLGLSSLTMGLGKIENGIVIIAYHGCCVVCSEEERDHSVFVNGAQNSDFDQTK